MPTVLLICYFCFCFVLFSAAHVCMIEEAAEAEWSCQFIVEDYERCMQSIDNQVRAIMEIAARYKEVLELDAAKDAGQLRCGIYWDEKREYRRYLTHQQMVESQEALDTLRAETAQRRQEEQLRYSQMQCSPRPLFPAGRCEEHFDFALVRDDLCTFKLAQAARMEQDDALHALLSVAVKNVYENERRALVEATRVAAIDSLLVGSIEYELEPPNPVISDISAAA
jgi:hypothetical protein